MRNDFSKSGSKSANLSTHSNFIPAASLPTFKCATGWQRKSQLIRNYNVKELICQSAAAADKEPHGAAAKHCLESINYGAINLPSDLRDDLASCLQAPLDTPSWHGGRGRLQWQRFQHHTTLPVINPKGETEVVRSEWPSPALKGEFTHNWFVKGCRWFFLIHLCLNFPSFPVHAVYFSPPSLLMAPVQGSYLYVVAATCMQT